MKGKSREDRVKELTDELKAGIREVFSSGRYQEYLLAMKNFHSYSYNNILLILMQKPEASLVAGYKTWETMGRYVRKGETGISILAPCPRRYERYENKIDPETREPILDHEGNPIKEKREITYAAFRPVSIFDVSQTDGKPLPTLTEELEGKVLAYRELMESIKEIAPAPIRFDTWDDTKKGYYSPVVNEIVIRAGMSELQTIKTAVHETVHSILHKEPDIAKDRATMEVEAESVAFVVCQHLGLDTSDYSFGYLAGWSSDKELPELQNSLSLIQKTSHQLIEHLDRELSKNIKNIDISQTLTDDPMEISSIADRHRHRR